MAKVVAFVVSLLGPGGGHVLVGRWRRGLVWLAVALACVIAARWTPLALVAGLPVAFGTAIDAARVAPREGWRPRWLAWIVYLVALQVVLFAYRHLVLEAFKIPASGMQPTLVIGDHIFVDHLDRDVQRGDIVLFRYPVEPDKVFIKRAVGIAGDHVQLRGGQLIVNGVPSPTAGERACAYIELDDFTGAVGERPATCFEERLSGRAYTIMHIAVSRTRDVDVVVPPGTIYVFGDNRENSHDSRYWGPVPLENVLGKPLYIWWSSPPGGDIPWHRLGRWIR